MLSCTRLLCNVRLVETLQVGWRLSVQPTECCRELRVFATRVRGWREELMLMLSVRPRCGYGCSCWSVVVASAALFVFVTLIEGERGDDNEKEKSV